MLDDLQSDLLDVAQAIGHAEGYYSPGSRSQRNNNPGDLTIGDEHGQAVSGYDGPFIIFSSVDAGFQALTIKLQNILNGRSSHYSPGMSWQQIGMVWADGDSNWGTNVAAALGVSPNDSLGNYFSDLTGSPAFDAGAMPLPGSVSPTQSYSAGPDLPPPSMDSLILAGAAAGVIWLAGELFG